MTTAYSAYGTLLKRGDGGVGAGAKAQVEWGSGNAKIRIKAKAAGTSGNGKNVTVVVSGSSFVTTSITASEVSITAPTTATVAMVIAYLYSNSTFDTYFDADYGATPGDGTGTITARTVTATSGGTDGTEIFTTIDGARNIAGPTFSQEEIDITNHSSASAYRERLPSFKSGGEVTADLLYNPADVTHEALFTDFENRSLRNFKMQLTDSGAMTFGFAAYVMGMEVQAPIDNALTVAVKLVVTGPVTRTP